MAPHPIRKYQESDRKRVLDLFSQGMVEHIPATFHHTLKLPQTLLLLLGVPVSLLLATGSWLLALGSNVTLLVFLWLLARYPWRKYVVTCLHTDLADITKSYLRACGSCFWVAESGGQVAGIVGERNKDFSMSTRVTFENIPDYVENRAGSEVEKLQSHRAKGQDVAL
uniref:N-acetyltransferase 8B n=1 Tax=Sciurus vulgaris TaxID=55149 RepID=A0A8D2DNV9_SCIVU